MSVGIANKAIAGGASAPFALPLAEWLVSLLEARAGPLPEAAETGLVWLLAAALTALAVYLVPNRPGGRSGPAALPALLLLLLAGCVGHPGYEAARGQVLEAGERLADRLLADGEGLVCRQASVRAVEERYWRSPEDFAAWRRFCAIAAPRADIALTDAEQGAARW